MAGSRSIVHDGWKATTDHVGRQISVERERLGGSHDLDADRWSLFELSSDFAEAVDVADEHPERVAELEALWWHEAGRNQVLPLDDSLIGRAVALEPSPNLPRHRTVYRPGGGGIAEDLLPPMGGGFRLTAHVAVPTTDGAEPSGVICALGDWNNGWALYVLEGRPVVAFCLLGAVHRAAGPVGLAPGPQAVTLAYERAWGGGGRVRVGVRPGHGDDHGSDAGVDAGAAEADAGAELGLPDDLPLRWQIGGAGLRIGHDRGFPVCDDYEPPFPFTGTIDRVEIEIPRLAPGPGDAPGSPADVTHSLHHE
jgi:arylsulfatase